MRRLILTSLVLIPVLAQAQTSTSTEPKPSTSSAMVQAKLTQPATTVELAMATPSAALPGSTVTPIAPSAKPAAIRELVQTHVSDSLADTALIQGGNLEYAMMGNVPTESSAPQLTRAVEVEMTQRELDEQPAVTHVVVRATVDAYGFPRNVSVAQSGGSVVDKKVVAAVNQYRFKPATVDNKAVNVPVTITIKIQKQ